MKKIICTAILLATTSFYAQEGKVGIGNTTPKATLDITGDAASATTADGIIAPRLTGDQLAAKDAVYLADQTGTQVYVTAAATAPAGKTVNVTAPGYYYFDGTVWQAVVSGTSTTDKNIYDVNGTLAGPRVVTLNNNDLEFTSTNGNLIRYAGADARLSLRPSPTTSSVLEFRGQNDTGGGYITFNENNAGSNALMIRTSSGIAKDIKLNTGNAGNIQFNPGESTKMIVMSSGNVGIGTATPNAQLQLGNSVANRKIVLYELLNNDNEYYGFGINSGTLRYQAGTGGRHAFFSGVDATSSKELMTIREYGSVGIGTASPNASAALDITSTTQGFLMPRMTSTERAAITTPATGLQVYDTDTNTTWYHNGTVWVNNGSVSTLYSADGTLAGPRVVTLNNNDLEFTSTNGNLIRFAGADARLSLRPSPSTSSVLEFRGQNDTGGGYITFNENNAGSNALMIRTSSGIAKDIKLNTGNAGNIQFNPGESTKMIVMSSGNVGIGTATPNAQLQLGNSVANRKIVLYELLNNDNEYYGFGINSGTLRYQAGTGGRHAFFSGVDATSSNELMTIRENGNVGIGTSTPTNKLEVNGNIVSSTNDNTEFAKIYAYNASGPSAVYAQASGTGNAIVRAQCVGTGVPIFDLYQNNNQVGALYYDSNKLILTPSLASVPLILMGNGGNVGIGITPTVKLEVNGAIKVGDEAVTSSLPEAGMIRFNVGISKFEGYDGTNWVVFH